MQQLMPCSLPAHVCLKVPNYGKRSTAEFQQFVPALPQGAQACSHVRAQHKVSVVQDTMDMVDSQVFEASGNKTSLMQVRNQNPQPFVPPAVPALWGGTSRARV